MKSRCLTQGRAAQGNLVDLNRREAWKSCWTPSSGWMGTIGPADRDSRNKFFAKRLLTERKYTHVQSPKACMLFGYSTWVRQQFDQVILEIFYQHISQNHPCVGHSRQECWSFFCPLTRICFLDWCIYSILHMFLGLVHIPSQLSPPLLSSLLTANCCISGWANICIPLPESIPPPLQSSPIPGKKCFHEVLMGSLISIRQGRKPMDINFSWLQ